MALTFRSNGVAGGLVSAAWWNDYYNLLTGVMTDQPVTLGNTLTVTGSSGLINTSGKWGVSSSGDVLDASTASTYIKARAGGDFHLQDPNGTDQFIFSGVNSSIRVNAWLGIRKISGTKLAEFKGDGTFIISGAFLETTGGSLATASGQSMDTFDVAEIFPCDAEYPVGTVVCVGATDNLLHQCTHDNCPCAMVVSKVPGFGIGAPQQNDNYIAMAGRVNVQCAQDVSPRTMVCSDGRGGVRTLNVNEGAFVLGFTLNSTSVIDGHPMVAIFLRPLFVTLKG